MTKLGYQIPNFTAEGVDNGNLFEAVAASARAAESAGADTIFVMDHFYQLPALGPPENAMLECYTLLAGLAGVTERVRLASLVTGNTYRNPTLLAKTVTALDIVSGGRAMLGIGAGWFELEHESLGYEFGTFTDRFEKLEEALQIIGPMLRDERPTLDGKHYQVKEAINQPAPIQKQLPIMIGGAGEKKTLRMVAHYADESNLICPWDQIPHKMEVLAGHCDRYGRDMDEIAVSCLASVLMAETTADAESLRDDFLRLRGIEFAALPDEQKEAVAARMFIGDPDTVTDAIQRELVDRGLPGLTFNLPATWHRPDLVELTTRTLAPLFTAS
jgi:F420-dependent oxidoreductase-like protein